MKVQRKIREATVAISFFNLYSWQFKNRNFVELSSYLKHEDLEGFDFRNDYKIDFILTCRYLCWGIRRFVLEEKDEDLPKARKQFQRFALLDRVVRFAVSSLFLYLVIKFMVQRFNLM